MIKVDIPVQPEQAELSYAEIKEKIIQRTVCYLPDYENIVHAVIATAKIFKLLNIGSSSQAVRADYLELFAPDRDDLKFENSQSDGKGQSRPTPPHNIRSLKCAIKDFYRLYRILQKKSIFLILTNGYIALHHMCLHTRPVSQGLMITAHYSQTAMFAKCILHFNRITP